MIRSLVMLLLLFPLTLSAQIEKRHQLSASVSVGSNPANRRFSGLREDVAARYGWDLNDNEVTDLDLTTLLMVHFAYHYRLTARWYVGALTGWGLGGCGYEKHGQEPPGGPDQEIVTVADGGFDNRLFYVTPSVRYQWHQSHDGMVRWYSGLAAGVYRQHLHAHVSVPRGVPDTDHIRWGMAYQVTALGFEMGTSGCMLFGEVGFGYQNTLALGVRCGI
jgi:hypothetical protein